ncbi:MAG: pilus assembly PilX family protein [Gammaproteobacteria bacterium]|jgi:Tfp pilus assembly protein PilX
MQNRQQQHGATLFVALIFLLIMTLFAISSINMSSVNLLIIGNMQAIKVMDAAAQDAIETKMNDSDNFGIAIAASTVGSTVSGTSFTVNVDAPECIDSQTAGGYSAVAESIIPEDNTWELTATVTDTITGATSTIHQGIEMRMLAGNCS